MAEILVKAIDHVHPDPEKDRRGAYKRGDFVEVREDGAPHGLLETLPKFVWIYVPGIPKARIQKYMEPQLEPNGFEEDGTTPRLELYRRRLWRLRWDDLPAAAKNKLRNAGQLVIGAGDYDGPRDYDWAQVKEFFRNQRTGLDETEDP